MLKVIEMKLTKTEKKFFKYILKKILKQIDKEWKDLSESNNLPYEVMLSSVEDSCNYLLRIFD